MRSVLRDELRCVLSASSDYEPALLAALVTRLARQLRTHFEIEETALWPVLKERGSRSISQSVDRQVERRVESLEREVEAAWRAVRR